ncbi:WecB/TagA/CpsF family glycosyltransferase [Nitrosococcus wardiae]|uniref:Glycosyltransferase n=1 Tax=Nitrosococcus wardiae TaxID=1814290 RepID=A0A4P7C0X1_9GAMM|nr:WecB/TagA/CpsF family glycosyltransferase [Nitrosococcus wardiae]QBQ54396.1 glycosyltransferase [Nitrosococcus wardiae]
MDSPVQVVYLYGLPLARISQSKTVEWVFERISSGKGSWIITANIDHLQRYVSDKRIADLYKKADLIVADGVPILWATRILGYPLIERVAGADLVWSLTEQAAYSGRSIYLLGGTPGTANKAVRCFCERWPELRIAGTSDQKFSSYPTIEEQNTLRIMLEAAKPDLIYVALGSPKQEFVIAALRPYFPNATWMGVGISLNFVTGEIRRAPVWMQKVGLEWAHRMLQEPRRLVGRYLINNLPFTILLLVKSFCSRVMRLKY